MQEEWVICRIFHKNGEKKNLLLQGQSYGLREAASSPSSGSLPALLETQTRLLECQFQSPMQGVQNPFLFGNQENDMKSLINPAVSQSHLFPKNGLQPSFSPIPTTITSSTSATNKNPSPSPSMLFKSLLSHQDCTPKEQLTIQKQCKTEANFSDFQAPAEAHLQWMDRIHPNPTQYQNPLLFEIDCGLLGLSAFASAPLADAAAANYDMSTSIAFNRAGF